MAANVHAQGLTTDQIAERLDGQLVGSGLLTPAETGRRNAAELVGALQRRLAAGADVPVVAIDGLDEARGESFAVAEDLLVRLAKHATVIVSTRDLPRDATPPTLVEALRPAEVLNLDEPDVLVRGRRALHDYVTARLATVDPRMDPAAVAGYLSDTWSGSEDRPFLLARLVTDQLRAVPVNTSAQDWQRLISHSTEHAFARDLAHIEDATAASLARALLTALTWGYGAGLPEEEWLVVASVLAGSAVAREDVSWVLDELGRYVVQDGEAGVAVYRLAHQSFADHLHPAFRPSQPQPFDPAALPIARALLDRYRVLIGRDLRPETPAYLWHYVWRHAAIAGPAGLDSLRDLARTTPALTLEVALAASLIASAFTHWGRRADAVGPAEEAVTLYRDLAVGNPAYQPGLAAALSNLGVGYRGVGRRADAVGPTEEAVNLRRTQAADNQAYQPNLAGTLTNLGIRYIEVGRRADAVAPTEQAVTLYRDLAAGDVTVPLAGGIRHGLALDTNRINRVADHHGNLQSNGAALDVLEGILTAKPVVRRDAHAAVELRVTVPDLVLAGADLPVAVTTMAVTEDRTARQAITITVRDEAGKVVTSAVPRLRKGHAEMTFTALPPGAYAVEVTGLATGSGVAPVSADVLIWADPG